MKGVIQLRYHKILNQAILISEKSLDQIAKECFMQGINITQSYLSKLQNQKTPPASDKVNNILEKVLNLNNDELLIAAYKERIPDNILSKLCS